MLLPAFCRLRFSSVAQSCLTLCDPMNCGMLGLPAHYQPLEFTQTHVHWVGDAIQQSYPLSSPSLPTFNLSHHQDLFKRPLLHTFEETDSKNPCIKQHKGKFENLRKMVSYNSRSFQIKGIQFIYFFSYFLLVSCCTSLCTINTFSRCTVWWLLMVVHIHDEKCVAIWIIIFLYVMCYFPLAIFNIFLSSLFFRSLALFGQTNPVWNLLSF